MHVLKPLHESVDDHEHYNRSVYSWKIDEGLTEKTAYRRACDHIEPAFMRRAALGCLSPRPNMFNLIALPLHTFN